MACVKKEKTVDENSTFVFDEAILGMNPVKVEKHEVEMFSNSGIFDNDRTTDYFMDCKNDSNNIRKSQEIKIEEFNIVYDELKTGIAKEENVPDVVRGDMSQDIKKDCGDDSNSIGGSEEDNKKIKNEETDIFYEEMKTENARSHTGEKLNQCQICSKYFTRKYTLKLHLRSHAGEKPYQCEICLKFFTQRSSLKIHERIHTGEKPFQCNICSKSFTQSGTLSVHERSHTGEKPYQCKICPKFFVDPSNLKKHERSHTGERPFQCNICSNRFTRRGHLKVHERSHIKDL